MLKRNIRLRREYLYRKSLEGKERLLYEKKRKIREALEEGKPIPTELRNEEASLRQQIDLEDENIGGMVFFHLLVVFSVNILLVENIEWFGSLWVTTNRRSCGLWVCAVFVFVFVFVYILEYDVWRPLNGDISRLALLNLVPRTHIDDEYANATESDPKILLTTSRNPSAPLTQFVKELSFVFPNAKRINRGGQVISEIIETCRSHEFTDVILVHEHRGVPDGLTISHLPFGPTAYFGLLNVVTRHDIKDKKAIGTMPEAYPHLILNNFSTKLGERTANILKHLFPVPKADTKRIITFANQSDYVSFRHHVYEKHGGPKSLELKEIGPRFELRLYQIKLGTVDQNEAQIEWVIRSYMNTSRKRKVLGD